MATLIRLPFAFLFGLLFTGGVFWGLWLAIHGPLGAIELKPAVRIDRQRPHASPDCKPTVILTVAECPPSRDRSRSPTPHRLIRHDTDQGPTTRRVHR